MSRELRDRLEAAQVKKVELGGQIARALEEAARVEKELEPFALELAELQAEVAELELATMKKSDLPMPPHRMPLQLGLVGFLVAGSLVASACFALRWLFA